MTCGTGKVLSSSGKSFLFQVLILISRQIKNGFLKKPQGLFYLRLSKNNMADKLKISATAIRREIWTKKRKLCLLS